VLPLPAAAALVLLLRDSARRLAAAGAGLALRPA
jgi:hypothetical protein